MITTSVPFRTDEDDSTALLQLCIVMSLLEFDAGFARLFPVHLPSRIIVNSVADNITFPQGQ